MKAFVMTTTLCVIAHMQLALLPLSRSKWFGFKSEEFVQK